MTRSTAAEPAAIEALARRTDDEEWTNLLWWAGPGKQAGAPPVTKGRALLAYLDELAEGLTEEQRAYLLALADDDVDCPEWSAVAEALAAAGLVHRDAADGLPDYGPLGTEVAAVLRRARGGAG